MSIRHTITLATTSLVLALSSATAAFAHAHLVRATPAAGGTVNSPPSEVTLNFNENLESAFCSVVVRDRAGKQVDKADAKVDAKDRKIMRVSLQPLPPGTYKVEWRAVSADMHKVDGNFTFVVGK